MSKPYMGVRLTAAADGMFWKITCPCGVTVSYPINGLPLFDIRHPCGNKHHWTIKCSKKYKKMQAAKEWL